MARYIRRMSLVLAGLVLLAAVAGAHAQGYECTQVVLQPGLATAYASAHCQTTNECHPASGCILTLEMQNASIAGSVESTAYQVPVAPLYCPYAACCVQPCVPGVPLVEYRQEWAYVVIDFPDQTFLQFVGEFDGPLASVNGHYEATGDFDLRDELFVNGFDIP